MRRANYLVTSSRGHRVVKHAWNSARLAVESIARDVARDEGVHYTRSTENNIKIDGSHTFGVSSWCAGAKTINFTIQKQEP